MADFDFEEEDVGNPESFSGRLRSSIVQYWSGLKGQTPPANTSYQNITFDWVRKRWFVIFFFFFFPKKANVSSFSASIVDFNLVIPIGRRFRLANFVLLLPIFAIPML